MAKVAMMMHIKCYWIQSTLIRVYTFIVFALQITFGCYANFVSLDCMIFVKSSRYLVACSPGA